jgi:membrane-associated progesterone receptor component
MIFPKLQIYDVTSGKAFYGPEGAYENLAGHDATRSFANFDVKMVKNEYDDWSGLNVSDLHDALEWEERFRSKEFNVSVY